MVSFVGAGFMKPLSLLFAPHRSYHSPTSELDIWWQKSKLSNWVEPPLVKNLYFHLKLGKSRLEGDRTQLEQLSHIIYNYTQELLTSEEIRSFSHELMLEKPLEVGTLELFDLLNSLEELEQDLALLPLLPEVTKVKNDFLLKKQIYTQSQQVLQFLQNLPAWVKVGTTVTIGIGLSFGMMQLLMPSRIVPVIISQETKPIIPKSKSIKPLPQRIPSFLGKSSSAISSSSIRIVPSTPPPPIPKVIATVPPKVPEIELPEPVPTPNPKLFGDLRGEFKMADQPRAEKSREEEDALKLNAARQITIPKTLVVTSNVQLDRTDQLERRSNSVDLNFSLSQHIRNTVGKSDRAVKGEVEIAVNLINGQVNDVQFDRSSLGDNALEQSITSAISSWQVPGNPNGKAKLTIKIW